MARVRVIGELLIFGLTLEDLRRIADRIRLQVEDPGRLCATTDSASVGSHLVTDRLAAIHAEVERLTCLRGRLAQRTGRV